MTTKDQAGGKEKMFMADKTIAHENRQNAERVAPAKIPMEPLHEEVRMFSNLIGRKIIMYPVSQISTACTASDKIYLNPGSDCIKGSSTAMAMLQHEEAHILFESNPGTMVPAMEKEYPDLANIKIEQQGFPSMSLVQITLNVLEDYRVEYMWQTLFPGSQRNFSKLYGSEIENMEMEFRDTGSKVSNPLTALSVARFRLSGDSIRLEGHIADDMLPMYKKFCSELEELEGRDASSTYIVGRHILAAIQEWRKDKHGANPESSLLSSLKELLSYLQQLGDEIGGNHVECKDADAIGVPGNESESEVLQKSAQRIRKLLDDLVSDRKKMEILNKLNDAIADSHKGEENRPAEKINSEGRNADAPMSQNAVKTTYGSGISAYSGPKIAPSPTISEYLKRLKLAEEPGRFVEADMGPKLNIKKLIRSMAMQDTHNLERIYLRREKPGGAEFITLLDISSSMADMDKINIAKRTLATIYDSVQESRLVKLRMFGFYGSQDGEHVFEMERNKLLTVKASGGTPTHIALSYLTAVIKRDKNANKPAVILITDGIPDNTKMTKAALAAMTKAAKIQEFTLFVSPPQSSLDSDREGIEDTFSPSTAFYYINSMQEVLPVMERIVMAGISAKVSRVRLYG